MNRILSPKRMLDLVNDLCDFRVDIPALMVKHGLDREDLAKWMQTKHTQNTLNGLCMLADYQAQLMASQYRVAALSRLVELATEKQDIDSESDAALVRSKTAHRELMRKACVDLLNANMERMDPITRETATDEEQPIAALREQLHAEAEAEIEP